MNNNNAVNTAPKPVPAPVPIKQEPKYELSDNLKRLMARRRGMAAQTQQHSFQVSIKTDYSMQPLNLQSSTPMKPIPQTSYYNTPIPSYYGSIPTATVNIPNYYNSAPVKKPPVKVGVTKVEPTFGTTNTFVPASLRQKFNTPRQSKVKQLPNAVPSLIPDLQGFGDNPNNNKRKRQPNTTAKSRNTKRKLSNNYTNISELMKSEQQMDYYNANPIAIGGPTGGSDDVYTPNTQMPSLIGLGPLSNNFIYNPTSRIEMLPPRIKLEPNWNTYTQRKSLSYDNFPDLHGQKRRKNRRPKKEPVLGPDGQPKKKRKKRTKEDLAKLTLEEITRIKKKKDVNFATIKLQMPWVLNLGFGDDRLLRAGCISCSHPQISQELLNLKKMVHYRSKKMLCADVSKGGGCYADKDTLKKHAYTKMHQYSWKRYQQLVLAINPGKENNYTPNYNTPNPMPGITNVPTMNAMPGIPTVPGITSVPSMTNPVRPPMNNTMPPPVMAPMQTIPTTVVPPMNSTPTFSNNPVQVPVALNNPPPNNMKPPAPLPPLNPTMT